MSVFFNGQLLVTPVTASAVNDDAMLNRSLSVGNAIAYIGSAGAGKPMEVLSFGNPDEARKVLVGGELCDAVVAAFSPSQETGAAQTVYAVRIDQVNAATLNVPMSDKPDTLFTVKGKNFKTEDQLTGLKIEAGSTAGLIKMTLKGKTSGVEWSVASPADMNAPRVHLEILTSKTNVFLNKDQIVVELNPGGVDKRDVYLDINEFLTLGAVADVLNAIQNDDGDFVAQMTFDSPDDRELLINVLDKAGFITTGKHALAWNAWAIEQWFTQYCGDYVTIEFDEAGKDRASKGPLTFDFRYLSAKASTALLPDHWDDALALLQTKDVQWVQAVSGSELVHKQVNDHCLLCSNVLRRERRSICGTGAGVSDADAIARAKALNSKRLSLVHIGHYAYNAAGKLALRPAYMTAGLVAAAFAGANPGTPLTNKTLNILGVERELRNPTDTDKLILGGVMPIENTETGYKVTQSITTWIGDSKYNNREQSCGVAIDFAIRNVRQAVDPLRGQKQSPILLSRAVSITKGALAELARPEPQGPAVLVGDENSPAYRNVTASVEGDVLRIQFEASPAIPNNYILVTMYAVPYSGSATA
ncbi:hypothetical protein ACVOZ6_003516 [Escherichia coli]